MGVQIEDPQKILSKHQLQKIKTLVGKYLQEQGEKEMTPFLVKEVLPSIYFAEEVKEPYNRISYRTDEMSGHVIVSLRYQSPDDLRKRLRTQLKAQTSLRKTSEDGESELWKRYALLKKFARANIRIPSPTDVRTERNVFEPLVGNMPNSQFKTYLQDCLA